MRREWDKISLGLLLLDLAIIGIGNVPRMHGSLAVFCITVFILCIKIKRKTDQKLLAYILRKGGLLLLCVVAYQMFVTIIPACYMQITGTQGLIKNLPPWHTIYISYGFEDNPYGIIYLDECAIDKAESILPGTEYFTDQYFNVIKEELFRMWAENPDYFIRSYARKIIICFRNVLGIRSRLMTVVIMALMVLWFLKKRRGISINVSERIWDISFTIINLVVSVVFPIIAIPEYVYMQGMYGAWGMLLLLMFCYCLADIELVIKSRWKRNEGK